MLDLRHRSVGLLGDVPRGLGLGHSQRCAAAHGLALALGGHLQATQPPSASDQAPVEVSLGTHCKKPKHEENN